MLKYLVDGPATLSPTATLANSGRLSMLKKSRETEEEHSRSRVLVVLPAHPVRDHKIRAHGNDEQGKVLVMSVLREDVKGLKHGSFFVYALDAAFH